MRRPILLWSALLAAFAAGQQLEATVYLPDSIIGVWDPRCLAVGAGRLVVGGAGEALVAVDCRSGARAGRLEFPFTVEAMAANPAGTRVFCAIAGEEMPPDSSTVFVVDPATMERTGALRAGRDPVALCVSRRHDRMYCVSRDDARLTLVSGDGETLLGSTAVRPNPVGLAYSEQLDRIYVRHWQDRWLTVADGGGAVLDSVDIGQYPSGAVLDERTQRLYVTYGSNLAVLNCSTGLVESRVFVGRFPVDVALDTTHDRLFLALNYSDAVAAVDCRTGQPVGQVGVGDSPTRLLWLPGADALLCANYLGSSVSVIDPAGLAVRSTIRTRHRPAMVLPDPDGARAWVAHEDDAAVSVLEPDSGTVVACYLLWEEPMAVGWNGSTRMLYCLTRQRRLYAVDGSARTVHFGVDVADGPVGLATDSAGAKVYVATGPDSLVTVYDGSSGVVLSRVKVGAQPTCLAGNPIDRKVYCCRRSRMQIIDAVVDSVRWGVSSVTNGSAVAHGRVRNKVYAIDQTTRTVYVVDGGTNGVIGAVRVGEDPTALGLNELSGDAYVTYPQKRMVAVIDGSTNGAVDSLRVPGTPTVVVGEGVGGRLFVGDRARHMLYVFDGTTRGLLDSVGGVRDAAALLWNRCDGLVYCADRQGDRVLAVAPGGDTVVLSIPVDGAPAALALDPAANRLYVMCERGSCIVLFRGVPGVAEAGPAASRPRPAVAPNPARGRVRVEPAGPGDTAVELVDAGGRVRSRRIVAAGCSAVELDLGAVRPGVYFVRVGAGRGAASARLVVVR